MDTHLTVFKQYHDNANLWCTSFLSGDAGSDLLQYRDQYSVLPGRHASGHPQDRLGHAENHGNHPSRICECSRQYIHWPGEWQRYLFSIYIFFYLRTFSPSILQFASLAVSPYLSLYLPLLSLATFYFPSFHSLFSPFLSLTTYSFPIPISLSSPPLLPLLSPPSILYTLLPSLFPISPPRLALTPSFLPSFFSTSFFHPLLHYPLPSSLSPISLLLLPLSIPSLPPQFPPSFVPSPSL